MLFLFFAIKLCSSDCTYKSNLLYINDDTGLDQLKDEYRPSFLRLTSPGCPYSPASQATWEYAANLFPQVNFVTVNCWVNSKICSLFGQSINTPYHGFVLANTSVLYNNDDTKFGQMAGTGESTATDITKSPNKFITVITRHAHLYPLSPPVAQLVPMTTDFFYKNAGDPIILTYNSQCSEETQFVSAWTKAANEQLFSTSDHLKIGFLDCSQFPQECQRWSRPYAVKTPRALIYSGKTGNFEILESYDSINSEKIEAIVQNLELLPNKPIPTPVPVSDSSSSKLEPGDYTLLENTNLQNRKVDDVKKQYIETFKAPSNACLGGCGGVNDNVDGCYAYQPDPDDHAASLKIINMFRSFAGLSSDVKENSAWSESARKAALNMHKSGRVPPDHVINDFYLTEKYCGEPSNKQVALDSLLSANSPSSFEATYLLFSDEGENNDGVVGHRRWLLHPQLSQVGFGFYPYKEKKDGIFVVSRPAVHVLRIRENNNIQYMENGVPSNLKFISWPPAGPFPIQHLPTNWHISHPSFKDAEVSDLEISITREDGMVLPIARTVIEKAEINKDALIMIMSPEAIERCQVTHTITVCVKNNKAKNFIRFSFELFDDQSFTEVCFYNSNKGKCPSSSSQFGPQQYHTCPALSSAKNTVRIQVVEPITTTQKLQFSAKQKFIITGSTITGTMRIQPNVVVDFQDPTQTDVEVEWKTVNKEIGKLETAKSAKSVLIDITDATDSVDSSRLVFYTGRETGCSLSKSVFRGSIKDVYYSLGGVDHEYYAVSSPVEAYENYLVNDPFRDHSELKQDYPGTDINTIYDLKDQVSYKRVVRVFFKTRSTQHFLNISAFIPGKKKDYIFVFTGSDGYPYITFDCNLNINKVVNSFTIKDLSDRYSSPLPKSTTFNIEKIDRNSPEIERQRCSINDVTISNVKYFNVRQTDIFFPSVLGDEDAKAKYPGEYVETIQPSSNTVDTYKTGPKSQADIELNSKYQEYLIKIDQDSDNKYQYLTFYPKKGDESKPFKIKFEDRSNPATPLDPIYTPTYYFENFQNLQIDHTIDSEAHLKCFHFINSKVSFKSNPKQDPILLTELHIPSGSINYGVPIQATKLSSSEEGRFELPNIETEELSVSNRQEFVSLKVTKKISLESSVLTLNSCTVSNDVEITITKTGYAWPSISLVDTTVSPKNIQVDLNIKDQQLKLLADEEPYESHILITGTSDCEAIKGKVTLNNNGKFELKCDFNDTALVLSKGTPPKYELAPEEEETSSDVDLDESPDHGKKLSGGAIAGIVIAVLSVVTLAVVGVFFFIQKRNGIQREPSSDVDVKETTIENPTI